MNSILQIIRKVLNKHDIQVDDCVVKEINHAIVKKKNPLLVSTEVKGAISTNYRRNVYFNKHFPVIEPTEYTYKYTLFCLCFTYSVLESVSYFTEKLVFDQESKYGSFQDGQYDKENTLLGVQETSFSIGLYIDNFEIYCIIP